MYFCSGEPMHVRSGVDTLIFCMGTYRVFEAPMRSFIRKRINTDRRPIAAAIILLFIGLPASLATYGWFVSLSGR
jgi:hypothetical protein